MPAASTSSPNRLAVEIPTADGIAIKSRPPSGFRRGSLEFLLYAEVPGLGATLVGQSPDLGSLGDVLGAPPQGAVTPTATAHYSCDLCCGLWVCGSRGRRLPPSSDRSAAGLYGNVVRTSALLTGLHTSFITIAVSAELAHH